MLEKVDNTLPLGSVTVNALNVTTPAPIQSAEGYSADIAGTGEQIAADSEISQCSGPIYVRKTRYVTMQ